MTRSRSAVAVGFVYFAAIMMITGVLDVLRALAAIVKQHYYVVGPDYLYKINVSTWARSTHPQDRARCRRFFLRNGPLWARVVGIVAAALVAVSNFPLLPYYP